MSRTVGDLQQMVMLAVARLGEQAYGATIRRELLTRAQRDAAVATIHVTLVRLEKQGLVESRRGRPVPGRGGRRKRYFRLTREGWRALHSSHVAIRRMWHGLTVPEWALQSGRTK